MVDWLAEDDADIAVSTDDIDNVAGMFNPDDTDMFDVSDVVDAAVFSEAGVEIAIGGVLWAVLEAIL